MKYFLVILIFSLCAYAKGEKKYTQDEFEKELKKRLTSELEKSIDRIKTTSIARLTKEVLEKERKIEEDKEKLKSEKEQLNIAQKSFEKRIKVFEKKQKSILNCIDENEKNENIRINKLVTIISNMKPLKAAELLSVQNPDISIKIMSLIKAQKASKIFNLMDKEISARLHKQYLSMQK